MLWHVQPLPGSMGHLTYFFTKIEPTWSVIISLASQLNKLIYLIIISALLFTGAYFSGQVLLAWKNEQDRRPLVIEHYWEQVSPDVWIERSKR